MPARLYIYDVIHHDITYEPELWNNGEKKIWKVGEKVQDISLWSTDPGQLAFYYYDHSTFYVPSSE